MKYVVCGLVVLVVHSFVCATAPAPQSADPSKQSVSNASNNNNITVNPTINMNAIISTKMINEICLNVAIAVHQNMIFIKEYMCGLANDAYDSTKSGLYNNRWRIFWGTAAAAYLAGNGLLYYYGCLLRDESRWFNWKKQLSLDEMLAIQQKELSELLIFEIQQRYLPIADPTNPIAPLICFLRDIDYEIALLERYRLVGRKLDGWHLSWVTLCDRTLVAECDDLLRRTRYVKTLFNHWMAEFKIDKLTTAPGAVQPPSVIAAVASRMRRIKSRYSKLLLDCAAA